MVRSLIKRHAPTWIASPWRRIAQTVCFALFAALFFYVCFPYTARPARQWSGWIPEEIDASTGRAKLAAETPLEKNDLIRPGQVLHVLDAGQKPPAALGAFRAVQVGDKRLAVEPDGARTPAQLDQLGASMGPWSLLEQSPDAWPDHYAADLARKEILPAESFLALDPLASISAAIAGRILVGALAAAAIVLMISIVFPRAFCSYVCPLGATIDLFDWAIARRVRRHPTTGQRWWLHLKYMLLTAVLGSAAFGVLLSGFVAAIPVVTRAFAFILAPLQTGAVRGWHQVPPLGAGQIFSIALFLTILCLGFVRPRFWCRYVCPTGALFSLGNYFRVFERRSPDRCAACAKCVEMCPFDAIEPDFSTRAAECAICRTCGGVCPTGAIEFGLRKKVAATEPAEAEQERRHFLRRMAGTAVGLAGGIGSAGAVRIFDAMTVPANARTPVRPPGSLPEEDFLATCLRCGECYRACPNDALQPAGMKFGLESLWTPALVPNWSGCEPSCANCGQVCPTGAIRPLPIEEKKAVRIGLAIVNRETCLPFAGHSACQLCYDECLAAGYKAIEFLRVGTQVDENGQPVEESGYLAPVVLADACVGCGLCQTRCLAVNGVQKKLLAESAIIVRAGRDREDRLLEGSYRELRESRQAAKKTKPAGDGSYLPEFLKQ